MSHQTLSTEKYWQEVLQQEARALRCEKNRQARQLVRNCILAVAVSIGVGYAIQSMPVWLPRVEGTLLHYGVIPIQIPADATAS